MRLVEKKANMPPEEYSLTVNWRDVYLKEKIEDRVKK